MVHLDLGASHREDVRRGTHAVGLAPGVRPVVVGQFADSVHEPPMSLDDVGAQLVDRATRLGLDRGGAHLATRVHRRRHARASPDGQVDQRVGVSGDVREHVSAGPVRQERGAAGLLVGDVVEAPEEMAGRIVDAADTGTNIGRHTENLPVGESAVGARPYSRRRAVQGP